MNAHASRRRAARGFTLIEVLISILIFSVGILGAIAMQAKLQQSSVQNGDRARASMLADELAAQMWAAKTVDPSSTALSTAYATWQTRVATVSGTGAVGLPNGAGSASYSSSSKTSTITITWKSPSAAASAASSSFVTSVVIP